MSFLPELFLIYSVIVIFIFSITFQYSFVIKFPLNSLYIVYVYSILIINALYLLSTELNISMYWIDFIFTKTNFTNYLEFIFFLFFIIYIVSISFYNNYNTINNFEFIFITINCFLICIFLLNSINFFILFILLEMLSIGLYVLAAFNKRHLYSIEAGLKYFILGSFSSSLILLGIVFLYGFTGFFSFEDIYMLFLYNSFFLIKYYFLGIISAFVLIILGFLFKLYSAPFHFWILDIYQGSPISSLLFFSTIYILTIMYLFSKLYFFIIFNFFFLFYYIYIFFSFSCIVFGILGALLQKKIRKIISFSTITFVGYYISAFISFDILSIEYSLHYLIIYIINLIGIFIFLLNITIDNKFFLDKLSDFNIFLNSNKILIFIFSILLFAISGMPPFWGFIGKIGLYNSLLLENNILFLIFFLLFTLFSFFYYIRIIKTIYFNTNSNWFLISNMNYLTSFIFVALFFINIYNFFFDNFFLSIVSFYSFSFLF